MVLLLGIDRLMSEARSFTNFCGNVVATVFMARMENAIDMDHAQAVLDGRIKPSNDPDGEVTSSEPDGFGEVTPQRI